MRITWLGHATLLIETASGARLLTDPLLRKRIGPLVRHAPLPPDPGRVDAVLLSHVHHDHLDVPSLRMVGAPVIGPPGSAELLTRIGAKADEMAPGEERDVAGARVRAVTAVHDGRRWPYQRRREDDSIGFVVADGGQRTYFAGDTEVFDGMSDLGPLDVALVPIWGWGPSLGPGHMDPGQAAQALALLRPVIAIPIHWGTYLRIGMERSHGHLLRDPVKAFAEAAAREAPDVRIEVLQPGASLDLTPRG